MKSAENTGEKRVAARAAGKRLEATFFASKDTVGLARALVGCVLCRRMPDGTVLRWELTELEAYDGPQDKACHAHKGLTPRTEVLFGEAGRCYVYLCYGMHWLLNFVVGPVGYPAAVLVRGAGPVMGPGRLTKALGIDKALNTLPLGDASGLWVEAGGLCHAADARMDGGANGEGKAPLSKEIRLGGGSAARLSGRGGLRDNSHGISPTPHCGKRDAAGTVVAALADGRRIVAAPRIGVAYAGPDWANRPYRFTLVGGEK